MDEVLTYSIISAIVGAGIGGILTLVGILINVYIQSNKEKELKRYSEYIPKYHSTMKLIDGLFRKFLETGEPIELDANFRKKYRELMLFLLLVSPDDTIKKITKLITNREVIKSDLALELYLKFRNEVFGDTDLIELEISNALSV